MTLQIICKECNFQLTILKIEQRFDKLLIETYECACKEHDKKYEINDSQFT